MGIDLRLKLISSAYFRDGRNLSVSLPSNVSLPGRPTKRPSADLLRFRGLLLAVLLQTRSACGRPDW